ncbi:DNA-processing protein DprA [Asaia bogorensis]|uniref:Rossmann fold nucleotide-binding protein Smf possibly involved in DNA uptake n=2 Tax=Asaia TaxID=91914 RepID=A0A060QLM5_9PROT|nr:DNA-processing protein DprA [Asaia bogorensis]CDG40886.1 Rossmann fold nucleotide-binding protein Smf possibly involved in DNA uptake [Asaia bogorensis]
MSAVSQGNERLDIVRLARTDGIGPVNFRRLMTEHGTAGAAIEALPERVRKAGRRATIAIPSRDSVEAEQEALTRLGGRMLLLGDPDYPALLSRITDAPPVLSLWGQAEKLSQRAIGVVGARNASAGGLRIAESLSGALAHEGCVIVSGLARGIDTVAHRAALHQGMTVGAAAGGLDYFYPPENEGLYRAIAERGCVVTEAPLGTIPQASHFPRRNRLIAGLSLGVILIEAAMRSGTLITARLALDYGRDVFAVPGSPLDPRSRGGNDLLRQGAILTETAQDVLNQIESGASTRIEPRWTGLPGFSEPESAGFSPPPAPENVKKRICELLSPTPVAVDDIVAHCQFSVSTVLSALSELELGGTATFLPGGQVVLTA